jgi:hypothetical protein
MWPIQFPYQQPPVAHGYQSPYGRPLVPIRLFRPGDGQALPEPEWGLVDSGSDVSLFPMRLAVALGLRPEGLPAGPTTANHHAGRVPVLDFEPGIDAELYGHRFKLTGRFGGLNSFLVLGLNDFWQEFRVEVDQPGRALVITPWAVIDAARGGIASAGPQE